MAIGEAGTLTRGSFGDGEQVTIAYAQPIENAVVVLTATNSGGNEFSLRIVDQDENGFTFILEEWEDEDGPHPATETINWLAIEEGVHTLPDGSVIEAGTTSADTSGTNVVLQGSYDSAPVVLTNVASNNETDVVDSDPTGVSTTGFTVSLEEGSLVDGTHVAETVNYIAIETGGTTTDGTASVNGGLDSGNTIYGLGATFDDVVILAETQTRNEDDAGNVVITGNTSDTVTLNFDEETGDGESAHGAETVGIAAFEAGIIPCFTPGALIVTPQGPTPVEQLQPGDLVLTRDCGLKPVLWRSQTTLPAELLAQKPQHRPVLIPRDAIAPGQPEVDQLVSPHHRVLITGWKAQLYAGHTEVLVPAKALCGHNGIRQVDAAAPVQYQHLLFDSHQVVLADNAWSESMHAGELDKTVLNPASRAELLSVLPDLRAFDRSFGDLARPTLSMREAALLAA